jgi:RimJ/RimL family protein N-acetyltransferase
MRTFPGINARHSVLTRISEDVLGILKEIFEDVETRRFLPELYELLDSSNGIQKFVSTFDLYTQNDEGYLWGVKHCDELVAFVAVMDLSDIPVLFYATHPNHRSRGYMKDALQSVLGYLSKKVVRTISTDVYKENSISIALLQQLGFCVCKEDDKKVYMSKVL